MLAHFLIDECGIDIIHGHSSHHVQGVENYNGKLIIYGCGDFVNDYAPVPKYRNDLSAVWRVTMAVAGGRSLKLDRLEMFPTKIESFQVSRLHQRDPDHKWLRDKLRALCAAFGTVIDEETGGDDQLIIRLDE